MDRRRIDGHLVVGGMAHDFDAVRLDLLNMAAADDRLRIRCSATFEEFGDGLEVAQPTFLVSYTCNLAPTSSSLERIRQFLMRGGRWLVLHATNSLLEWRADGVAAKGLEHPFLALIGAAFQAHPPYGRFRVQPSSSHPLVKGLPPFDINDELYLADVDPAIESLLTTDFSGEAPGFVRRDWTTDTSARPMMFLRHVGKGAILHLALGHRRGHYDAPHRTPYVEHPEHGPWQDEVFRNLLARSLRWTARTDPELEAV
ncbi:MAG: ThuA domain-containing protein [Sandaracinobacter sp.]